jgi:hypothetical protein
MSPVIDPRRTDNEQLLTASRPPNRFVTLRTSITRSVVTKRPEFPESHAARLNPGNFVASAHKRGTWSTPLRRRWGQKRRMKTIFD